MNGATVRRVVRGKIADASLPRDRIGAVSVAYECSIWALGY